MGNARSNFGLYEWDGVPEKMRPYVGTGDPVTEPPEEMSRIVKKVGRLYGADLVGWIARIVFVSVPSTKSRG